MTEKGFQTSYQKMTLKSWLDPLSILMPEISDVPAMHIITKLERAIKEDQVNVFYSWLENYVAGKKELRRFYRNKGFVIPNSIFLEITNQCNRKCVHCALPFDSVETMPFDMMVDIIGYFKAKGTYGVGIVGGEPFLPALREVLFNVAHVHNDILFWIYTNGDFIDENVVSSLDQVNNVVPLISLEGTKDYHDSLRGEGSYEAVERATRLLGEKGLAKGHSVTVSKGNRGMLFEPELLGLIRDDIVLCMLRYRAVGNNPNRKKVLPKGDYTKTYSELLELCKGTGIFPASDISGAKDGCTTSYNGSLYIDATGNIKKCAVNKVIIPFGKDMTLRTEMFQSCSVGEYYGCKD